MKYAIRISSLFAVTLWAGTSLAVREGDLSKTFPINDDDPTLSVPTEAQRNADPLEFGYWLQDMVHRAETPFQEGKWAEAVKYYEALGVALPETALNYSKLCTGYENLGDLAKAEANCWAGLQHAGSKVATYYQYLRLAIAMLPETAPGAAKDARLARITQTLDHLRASAPQVKDSMAAERAALQQAGEKVEKEQSVLPFELQVELLACQLGLALNDTERLTACVKALPAAGSPRQMMIPFEWALLKNKGASAGEMNALLVDAQRVGLPEKVIASFRASAASAPPAAKAVKYHAPVDISRKEPPAVPADANGAAEAAEAPAAAAERPTSPIENVVAGLAAVIGLGALGWWLRERGQRRGSATQPLPSNPGA